MKLLFRFITFTALLAPILGQVYRGGCGAALEDLPDPASESCVAFFRCYNFRQYSLRCPLGQAFHFDRLRCRPENQVDCPLQLQRFQAPAIPHHLRPPQAHDEREVEIRVVHVGPRLVPNLGGQSPVPRQNLPQDGQSPSSGQATQNVPQQTPQLTIYQPAQGQVSQGQATQGQPTQGQLILNQTPQGQTPQGQTFQSQTPQGPIIQGQTPQGQTFLGLTSQGQPAPSPPIQITIPSPSQTSPDQATSGQTQPQPEPGQGLPSTGPSLQGQGAQGQADVPHPTPLPSPSGSGQTPGERQANLPLFGSSGLGA